MSSPAALSRRVAIARPPARASRAPPRVRVRASGARPALASRTRRAPILPARLPRRRVSRAAPRVVASASASAFASSDASPSDAAAPSPGVDVSGVVTQMLAGVTVSLAMVPESLAFTFVAGVSPIVGLHAAALMCLVTAALGAQPGVISGAAGATAVVLAPLVASHGPEYLFASVALTGAMQLAVGAARLGKFIRLVPQPCMIGFVNGLAIVIGRAQLDSFRGLAGSALHTQVALTAGTAALVKLLPLLPFAWSKRLPAPLVAIGACGAVVTLAGIPTKTVGDVAAVAGTLPAFHLPAVPASLETLGVIAPYAFAVAAVGLIETLLTQQLVDDVTSRRTSTHAEVLAQGAANVACGFASAMGGCAMIGQSMINVQAGGRTRVAGLTCAAAILAYVTFGAGFIERVPIAALTGVMLILVLDIFDWTSFARVRKIPKTDAATIALVTVATVATNLAVAVFAGVALSALGFAWKSASRIDALRVVDDESGAVTYRVVGPLFFGSARGFAEKIDAAGEPPGTRVAIDFAGSRVCDSSAIVAIDELAKRCEARGVHLALRHLSADCAALLERAGDLVEVSAEEDPRYRVAADYGRDALDKAEEKLAEGGETRAPFISVEALEGWERDALERQISRA